MCIPYTNALISSLFCISSKQRERRLRPSSFSSSATSNSDRLRPSPSSSTLTLVCDFETDRLRPSLTLVFNFDPEIQPSSSTSTLGFDFDVEIRSASSSLFFPNLLFDAEIRGIRISLNIYFFFLVSSLVIIINTENANKY
ncbi:unnamed protein product [Camellia sinensis]